MITSKYVPMKSILWVFVGLTYLLVGCQVALPEEAVTATIQPPTTQFQTLVTSTSAPEKTPSRSTTPPLIQPSIVATEQITGTVVPIPPIPTVIKNRFDIARIYPQIALLCGETGRGSSICIFNTQANVFGIIARATERFSYGRPLWSPDKELLAFAQLDFDIGVPYVHIYNPDKGDTNYLALAESQSLDDDTQPSTFLYGWSNDSNWLAYCYIYKSLEQNCYLVNLLTQENASIELPNSTWFAWSPHDMEFAMIGNEAIYIANPLSPNEMTVYQGSGFVGLIAWHPTRNELLVGSKKNSIEEGLSQLGQLNIDTGEWIDIGAFPHMAHFEFSPDGHFIAIHSQSRTLDKYRLEIIDASTFESAKQVELPSKLFFDLDWIDNQTLALTTNDNIYVVPLNRPNHAYWFLDDNNPLYEKFSQIAITDW